MASQVCNQNPDRGHTQKIQYKSKSKIKAGENTERGLDQVIQITKIETK